jgi:hypothetical protein
MLEKVEFASNNICFVRRAQENGMNYGFDLIYMCWYGRDGQLYIKPIYRGRDHEYAYIDSAYKE